MKSILLPLLWFLVLLSFCTAQCYFSHLPTPPPPGSTDPIPTHCNLPDGVALAPGEVHTNMTSCHKCHCGANLVLYCCGMLWSYMVPDECVVINKNCTQKIVYKSDGSPCQPLAAASRK